nr:MAG TPA: hypothetical protein [Caudoviricetes sp.]
MTCHDPFVRQGGLRLFFLRLSSGRYILYITQSLLICFVAVVEVLGMISALMGLDLLCVVWRFCRGDWR